MQQITPFLWSNDNAEEAVMAGGQPLQCGWLNARFAVSWQIVPAALGELLLGDCGRTEGIVQALLQMEKLDVENLWRAVRAG